MSPMNESRDLRGTLRDWCDVIVAGMLGLSAEIVIWVLDVSATHQPYGNVPVWIQICQSPGTRIADRLLRQIGPMPALAIAVLLEATLFSSVVLSLIYLFRLIKADRKTKALQ
jgi:hypothetical protein